MGPWDAVTAAGDPSVRGRIRHLWLCDPRIKTLEVSRLEGGRWLELETYEGDVKVRSERFDAIELDLGRLFRW